MPSVRRPADQRAQRPWINRKITSPATVRASRRRRQWSRRTTTVRVVPPGQRAISGEPGHRRPSGVLIFLDELILCGRGRHPRQTARLRAGKHVAPESHEPSQGNRMGGGDEANSVGAAWLLELWQQTVNRSISPREVQPCFQPRPHYWVSPGLRGGTRRRRRDRSGRRQLLAKSAPMGGLLRGWLGERFGNHPHVGDIRAAGLFQDRGIASRTARPRNDQLRPDQQVNAPVV